MGLVNGLLKSTIGAKLASSLKILGQLGWVKLGF